MTKWTHKSKKSRCKECGGCSISRNNGGKYECKESGGYEIGKNKSRKNK